MAVTNENAPVVYYQSDAVGVISINNPPVNALAKHVRLAIAEPQKAGRLCERVTTPGADEKCRQVLGRPHLQTTPKPPKDPAQGGGPR